MPVEPRQFEPPIPDRFQEIVLKLLEKRPEDRFLTAAQLLEELERVAKW